MKWLTQAAGSMALVSAAWGADAPAPEARKFTLEECQAYALSHNSSVRQAAVDIRIAEEENRGTRAGLLPSVDARLEYNHWNEPQYLRFGQGPATQVVKFLPGERVTGRLGLSQVLIDPGLFHGRLEAARLGRDEAEARSRGRAWTIAARTRVLFHQALYYQQCDSLYRENVTRNRQMVDIAHKRVDAGNGTQSDVYRAEVAAWNAVSMEATADGERRKAFADLAELMGRDSGSFALEGGNADTPRPVVIEKDAETAFGLAEGHRADFRETRLRAERLGALSRAAKGDLWPKLSFQAEALYDGPNTKDEFFNNSDRGLKTDSWRVGLLLQSNLFAGGRDLAQARRSRLQVESAAEEEAGLKRRVRADILNALTGMQVAQSILEYSHSAETQARENLRVVQVKYQNGTASSLDYTDALNVLVLAEATTLQRRFELRRSLLALEEIMGTDAGFLAAPH